MKENKITNSHFEKKKKNSYVYRLLFLIGKKGQLTS